MQETLPLVASVFYLENGVDYKRVVILLLCYKLPKLGGIKQQPFYYVSTGPVVRNSDRAQWDGQSLLHNVWGLSRKTGMSGGDANAWGWSNLEASHLQV